MWHFILINAALTFCALGSLLVPFGVEVTWQSQTGGQDFRSDGLQRLDGSFQFEIGDFKALRDDFIPTSENVLEWQSNWRSFGVAQYDETLRRIRGRCFLQDNAVFSAEDSIFLWGYNVLSGVDAEWILMRNTEDSMDGIEWQWPGVGPLSFPVAIAVSQVASSEVIIGEVGGEDFQMRTARPFALDYDQWVQNAFSVSQQTMPLIVSPTADPDSDGQVNIIEFALGTNPLEPTQGVELFNISTGVSEEGDQVIELKIRRPQNADVRLDLRKSPDLTQFNEEQIFPEMVQTSADGEWLIVNIEVEKEAEFYRLFVSAN